MKLEPIGILAAVAEEINAIKARVSNPEEITIGKAKFTTGTLNGVKVVVALLENGWGKVDASATVTTLILSCNVKAIIFSGLGGAVDPALTVGDIVISNTAFQHDFSGEPFFPQCHIPSANTVESKADPLLITCAEKAAQTFICQFVKQRAIMTPF
ncbi:MAG: 5'-methylthioadenosine/S-adenosylhomocysteine nucleosidase [Gammaproteobacteria bacterium]|nr:5'-methylthioadenosine/S-adenosylhomocysteine nucleosidase [Gammaproteobacteria bacterium]